MGQEDYPQLRDVETHDRMASDEYKLAKWEAIQKTTDKEYWNAILATAKRIENYAGWLGKIFFVQLLIFLLLVYFVVKDIMK